MHRDRLLTRSQSKATWLRRLQQISVGCALAAGLGLSAPAADSSAPVVAGGTQPKHSATSPANRGSLAELLLQKGDVDFWRDYPREVIRELQFKYGTKIVCASMLDESFIYTHKAQGVTVREIIDGLAVAGSLQADYAPKVVWLWQKADDQVLAKLEQGLQSPDRWVRAQAGWELSGLTDKRIYPALFKLCGDSDRGVAIWALKGLLRHERVLPYIDTPEKEVAVQALLKLKEGAKNKADLNGSSSFGLLGALGTDTALTPLLDGLNSENPLVRSFAAQGLGHSTNPKAAEALLALADKFLAEPASDKKADHLQLGLAEALSSLGSDRAVDALIALAEKYAKQDPGSSTGIYYTLARTPNLKAEGAVLKYMATGADRSTNKVALSAYFPSVAQVYAERLNEKLDGDYERDARALAEVRDPRALAPLLYLLEKQQWMPALTESLAALRDSRAEAALLKLVNNDKTVDQWGMRNYPVALMATRDPKIVDLNIATMKDPNAKLEEKKQAAKALGAGVRTTKDWTTLVQTLMAQEPEVSKAAVLYGISLTGFHVQSVPDNATGYWLAESLHYAASNNQQEAMMATQALGRLQGPGVMKALLGMMTTGAPNQRAMACRSAISQGQGFAPQLPADPAMLDGVAGRLEDEAPAVRNAAAMTLAGQGDVRGLPILLDQARATRDTMEAMQVFGVLAQISDPRVEDVMLEALTKRQIPQWEILLNSMDLEKSQRLREAVLKMALNEEETPTIRATAAMRLSRISETSKDALSALVAILKSPTLDWNNHVYCVGTLVSSKEFDGVGALVDLAKDNTASEVGRAETIAFVDPANMTKEQIEKYSALLDDQNLSSNIRARVAATLAGAINGRGYGIKQAGQVPQKVVQALVTFYKNPDLPQEAKRQVREGLAICGDPQALALLRDNLAASKNPQETLNLAITLAQTRQDEAAVAPLLDLLKNGDPATQTGAFQSLSGLLYAQKIKDETKKQIKAGFEEYKKNKDKPVAPPAPPKDSF